MGVHPIHFAEDKLWRTKLASRNLGVSNLEVDAIASTSPAWSVQHFFPSWARPESSVHVSVECLLDGSRCVPANILTSLMRIKQAQGLPSPRCICDALWGTYYVSKHKPLLLEGLGRYGEEPELREYLLIWCTVVSSSCTRGLACVIVLAVPSFVLNCVECKSYLTVNLFSNEMKGELPRTYHKWRTCR